MASGDRHEVREIGEPDRSAANAATNGARRPECAWTRMLLLGFAIAFAVPVNAQTTAPPATPAQNPPAAQASSAAPEKF